jgi:hypothetical protein
MGGAGVQKSLKFVKYMKQFDYEPIVLTVNSRFTRWIKDKSLCSEIPQGTVVYRTPTIDVNWLYKALWGLRLHRFVKWMQLNIMIPDSEITWLPFAKRAIKKIITRHQIDLAYISGGPFSSMLLGPLIKDKYNIDYVLDFRDEWTNNPTRLDLPYPMKSIRKESEQEKEVLHKSAAIVYTIPKYMKENFELKYPFLVNKLSAMVTNGYDDDDFDYSCLEHKISNNHCNLVYTGSFYDRRQPTLLWKAICELDMGKIGIGKDISIKIIGKNKKSFVLGEYTNNQLINRMVEFYPNLERKRAIAELSIAQALLLYIAPGPNCKAEMTGKIFDYIRVGRPILAIIPPDGAAADIIRKSKTGFIYDSNNLEDIKKGIMHIYTLWQTDKLTIEPDTEYIAQFNRINLTKKLASLFDQVLNNNNEQSIDNNGLDV